jgi:hypothetical protein
MAAYGTTNQPASAVPAGGLAGWGTFNLPNFVGELFKTSPLETPLLSTIGGMSGGESIASVKFSWQTTQHRAPALQGGPADRTFIEGDDATFQVQDRSEIVNVAEIFQYGVELTYSKQAASGMLSAAGLGALAVPVSAQVLGNQPVQDEMAWQLQIKLEQCALDLEIAFLTGTLAYAANGTTRATQGISGAVAAATSLDGQLIADFPGAAHIVNGDEAVNVLAQAMFDEGAPLRNVQIHMGSAVKRDVSSSFQGGNGNISPRSYNKFGVNATEIETDFGNFPMVLNRHIAVETMIAIEMDVTKPCFMPIPGKGHFFLEPLAKSGSYDRQQLYGEIGLKYGPPGWHGKVDNLDFTSNTA